MSQGQGMSRRQMLGAGAVGVTGLMAFQPGSVQAEGEKKYTVMSPPEGKRILLSCKLSMITKKDSAGKEYSIVDRLTMAKDAGFDGVDFDEAGNYTVEQVRQAMLDAKIFLHNAINHAHWTQRLTSAKEDERNTGRSNIEHCLRVSQGVGGSGVLIVLGRLSDGTKEETEARAAAEINKLIPLAAALGQRILIENVWNHMMYDHDKPPEQSADRFVKFVDSFNSPWVGMYYDIGNHWKYGQPLEWLRAFGPRAVKLDVKGFSRKKDKFVDITSEDDDVPWADVQKGLKEIGFAGWTTAEVKGGDTARLTEIRKQMEKAFGL